MLGSDFVGLPGEERWNSPIRDRTPSNLVASVLHLFFQLGDSANDQGQMNCGGSSSAEEDGGDQSGTLILYQGGVTYI